MSKAKSKRSRRSKRGGEDFDDTRSQVTKYEEKSKRLLGVKINLTGDQIGRAWEGLGKSLEYF